MKKQNSLYEVIKFAIIFAIPMLILYWYPSYKRNSEVQKVTISNNRAQIEREIRKMLKEDSLCLEFFQGIIPVLVSDTIHPSRWFNENVPDDAKEAFKAKWDSLYKDNSAFQARVLFGILSENPGVCGFYRLTEAQKEKYSNRITSEDVPIGYQTIDVISPEEVELIFSGIKMPDGSPIFPSE